VQEKSYAAAVEEQRRIMKEHGQELSMDVLGEMETLHLNIQGEALGSIVWLLTGCSGVT
jgi:hypothetical protein